MINAYTHPLTGQLQHGLSCKVRSAMAARPALRGYDDRGRWISAYAGSIQSWLDSQDPAPVSWGQVPDDIFNQAQAAADQPLGIMEASYV